MKTTNELYLWRYMDITKFLQIIISNSFNFCRSDIFLDPFEGTINSATHNFYIENAKNEMLSLGKDLENIKEVFLLNNKEWIVLEKGESSIGECLNKTLSWLRSNTYINCWHENTNESEAMWNLYTKNISEAVVVKTKIELLRSGLPQDISIQSVAYMDFQGEEIMKNYCFSPFTTKRISFKHENEVRLIMQIPIYRDTDKIHKSFNFEAINDKKSINIPLTKKLNEVITEIRLSPKSEPWVKDMVSIIMKKYKIDIPIIDSEICRQPFSIK